MVTDSDCPGARTVPGPCFHHPGQCVGFPRLGRAWLGPLESHGGSSGPQSQDCIAAALACSKILKELSKEEEDTDSSEEMLALAEECEHRAIGELCQAQAAGHGSVMHAITGVPIPGSQPHVPSPWGPRPWVSALHAHPGVLPHP